MGRNLSTFEHLSGNPVMWTLESAWWEVVVRALVVYAGVFILFRLVGKKQLGELSPFDFILLLIVSESVSNGLGGEEHSLSGALLSATTLLILSRTLDFAAHRSRRFEKILDGEAKVIIQDGRIVDAVARKSCITHAELMCALRQHEVEDPSELKFAILETNGKITVIKKNADAQS